MASRFIDLSHVIHDNLSVFPGLPPPKIRPLFDHRASRSFYDSEAEFCVNKIEMPGSCGTYLDAPFHRFEDLADLSQIPLSAVAGLDGLVLKGRGEPDRPVAIEVREEELVKRAVLVSTGWDERWGQEGYWRPSPHLSLEFVERLVKTKARLVGVDFGNVDDQKDLSRPVHTRLLKAGVLIVENLTGLDKLPRSGFKFYAVPLRIEKGASFPVRAFGEVEE